VRHFSMLGRAPRGCDCRKMGGIPPHGRWDTVSFKNPAPPHYDTPVEASSIKNDFSGIRTHARKTAALTQRLRPLGHEVGLL
jgi:hypothetical protein